MWLIDMLSVLCLLLTVCCGMEMWLLHEFSVRIKRLEDIARVASEKLGDLDYV